MAPPDPRTTRVLAYSRVISDVIVVNKGLALRQTAVHQFLAVHELDLSTASPPRGFVDPVGRVLDLDDGTTIEVAFSAQEIDRFVPLV